MNDLFKTIGAAESSDGRELSDVDLRLVADECFAKLVFPANKPVVQFLLCPIGLVGSGKTSVLHALQQHLDFVRVSTDDIRAILKRDGFNFQRTAELAMQIVVRCIEGGFSVALDADCARAGISSFMEKFVADHNVKLAWIHIKTPESVILERLAGGVSDRTYVGPQAISDYHRRKPLHDEFQVSFVYVFNETTLELSAQIPDAVKAIRAKLGLD